MNKMYIVILIAVFFQALLWAMIIPIWHFPDEQAHFAQVQNYAELGRNPDGRLDLSYEIALSEKLLETYRDNRGNNAFTYNPTYRIPYTNTPIGTHEEEIAALPVSSRTEFVRNESPRYPPIYYTYSSLFYRLVYPLDLINRVMVVRIGSILLHLGLVVAACVFAKSLFPKSLPLQIGVTSAVAFHPMLMFVGSGINNDILMNLISVLLLRQMVSRLRFPVTLQHDWPTVALVFLGIFTKQLIYFFIPSLILYYFYRLIVHKKCSTNLVMLLIILSLITFILLTWGNDGFWLPFWPAVNGNSSEIIQLMQTRLLQLYRETLPWYWGVYKWLGVVLPLWLLRLIKMVMVLALVGWFVKRPKNLKPWILLGLVNCIYISLLVLWDISMTLKQGFGHGIQGRYFFPLIASHMAFLVYGLSVWLTYIKSKAIGAIILVMFLSLNYYSLYHVMSQYFDVSTLTTFSLQVSQYKPVFVKWPAPLIVLLCSVISHVILIMKVSRITKSA